MQPACLLTLSSLFAVVQIACGSIKLNHTHNASNSRVDVRGGGGPGDRCGSTSSPCGKVAFSTEREQQLQCVDDAGVPVQEGLAGRCFVPLDGMCESGGLRASKTLPEEGCKPGTTCTYLDFENDMTLCMVQPDDPLPAPVDGIGSACSRTKPCPSVTLDSAGPFGFVDQKLKCLDEHGEEVAGQQGSCWIPKEGFCFHAEGCAPKLRCDGLKCRKTSPPRELGESCDDSTFLCGFISFDNGNMGVEMGCIADSGDRARPGRAGRCYIEQFNMCEYKNEFAGSDERKGCQPGTSCEDSQCMPDFTVTLPVGGDIGTACKGNGSCPIISYFETDEEGSRKEASQQLQCYDSEGYLAESNEKGTCLIPEGGSCNIPGVGSQGSCARGSYCDDLTCEKPPSLHGPRSSAPGHFIDTNTNINSGIGELCDTIDQLCGSTMWMDLVAGKEVEQQLACYDDSGKEVKDGRVGTCWIPASGFCRFAGSDASDDHEEKGCKPYAACKLQDAEDDTSVCEDFDTFAKYKGDVGETCNLDRPCATLIFVSAAEIGYNRVDLQCYGKDETPVREGQFGKCWHPSGGFCDQESAEPGCVKPLECSDYMCKPGKQPNPPTRKKERSPRTVSGLGEVCDNVHNSCGAMLNGQLQLRCLDDNGKHVKRGRAGKCFLPMHEDCGDLPDVENGGCHSAAACAGADDMAELMMCIPDLEFERTGDTGDVCGADASCGSVAFYFEKVAKVRNQQLKCHIKEGQEEGKCVIPTGGYCHEDFTQGRSCIPGNICKFGRCRPGRQRVPFSRAKKL